MPENKFETYQPPVTRIQDRRMAEDLIVRGHILSRVEPNDDDYGANPWVYIFAGTSAKAVADEITSGKITVEQSPRNEAARRLAKGMISEAIFEHKRRESLQRTFKEVTEAL